MSDVAVFKKHTLFEKGSASRARVSDSCARKGAMQVPRQESLTRMIFRSLGTRARMYGESPDYQRRRCRDTGEICQISDVWELEKLQSNTILLRFQ